MMLLLLFFPELCSMHDGNVNMFGYEYPILLKSGRDLSRSWPLDFATEWVCCDLFKALASGLF